MPDFATKLEVAMEIFHWQRAKVANRFKVVRCRAVTPLWAGGASSRRKLRQKIGVKIGRLNVLQGKAVSGQ